MWDDHTLDGAGLSMFILDRDTIKVDNAPHPTPRICTGLQEARELVGAGSLST